VESQTIVQLVCGGVAVLCVVIIVLRRKAKKDKDTADPF